MSDAHTCTHRAINAHRFAQDAMRILDLFDTAEATHHAGMNANPPPPHLEALQNLDRAIHGRPDLDTDIATSRIFLEAVAYLGDSTGGDGATMVVTLADMERFVTIRAYARRIDGLLEAIEQATARKAA